MNAEEYKNKVLSGARLTFRELKELSSFPARELARLADEIRARFCGNGFELCAIASGKSGRCSENCAYCAQSSVASKRGGYSLLSADLLLEAAERAEAAGARRFSVVISGKKASKEEIDGLCAAFRMIAEKTSLSLCASCGLLSFEALSALKSAGVTRYHNNLETSREFFPKICSSHSWDEKITTLRNASEAGLEICSGVIVGMGETEEDRLRAAMALFDAGARSVPLNILNPIPGTPLENLTPIGAEEILKTVALYRFALPEAAIRLAGGRTLMKDGGLALFKAGANAAITGDMLTTSGIDPEFDVLNLKSAGYVGALL